jgi:hypothetical protein
MFIDNQEFPNQSEENNLLLRDIDGGTILRKLKHPPPHLDVVDSGFHFPFDEAIHGKRTAQLVSIGPFNSAQGYCPCQEILERV